MGGLWGIKRRERVLDLQADVFVFAAGSRCHCCSGTGESLILQPETGTWSGRGGWIREGGAYGKEVPRRTALTWSSRVSFPPSFPIKGNRTHPSLFEGFPFSTLWAPVCWSKGRHAGPFAPDILCYLFVSISGRPGFLSLSLGFLWLPLTVGLLPSWGIAPGRGLQQFWWQAR